MSLIAFAWADGAKCHETDSRREIELIPVSSTPAVPSRHAMEKEPELEATQRVNRARTASFRPSEVKPSRGAPLFKGKLRRWLRSFYSRHVFSPYLTALLKSQTDAKVSQLVLQQQYKNLVRMGGGSLPSLREVGFRQYSQFEEDGILLYLFSIITPVGRSCLELCAGTGIECNTANLIVNHGWWGHLFDGDADNVARGRAFYAHHHDTFLRPPNFSRAWITAENVNQLVADSGLRGPVDLLSLDMDGNDYWIWKALEVVEPTVVICETHNTIPPDLALTIPYNPTFQLGSFDDDFRGASLKAMVNLGRAKGYRLVGTHRFGFNAFFIKNGMADDLLPEVSPEQCAGDPYTKWAQAERWQKARHRDWVAV